MISNRLPKLVASALLLQKYTQVEGEVDAVGELSSLMHRGRHPRRLVVVKMEVREVGGRVGQLGHTGITRLADTPQSGMACLGTVSERGSLGGGRGGYVVGLFSPQVLVTST